MNTSTAPSSIPLLRTVVRFVLLLVLFNGIYYVEKTLWGRFIDLPYTYLVTRVSAGIGKIAMPIPVDMRGDITLGSGNAAVVIRGGCNGLEAVFLLLAGILAYPASWHRRGQAFLVYLPILFFLNVLRILLLLYIMAAHPQHIDLFHYQIGQGVLVVFVFAFWMHYVHWAER